MTPKTAPRKEGEEYGDQVLSKTVKAGRRTYFFDVRATRADDYFITITESRKLVDADGRTSYDRHKIFLYKEDFDKFAAGLLEAIQFYPHLQTRERRRAGAHRREGVGAALPRIMVRQPPFASNFTFSA